MREVLFDDVALRDEVFGILLVPSFHAMAAQAKVCLQSRRCF